MYPQFLQKTALLLLLVLSCISSTNAQCTWFTKISSLPIGYSTLGIKSDSTLWAWGDGSSGQLGDGTTYYLESPTKIGNATNWVSVSAGLLHSVGIKADGTLWAWGKNDYGQLGDGTGVNKLTPTQIGTATDWKSIAAGGRHNIAIKTDGTLWAWGANFSSQVGNGTTATVNIPVQLGTATDWVFVTAGFNHSMALKSDGTLWAWGTNTFGHLGDGTKNGKSVPTQIGDDTDWASVATGDYHTLGIKTNGTLWAWGENNAGALGIGSTTDKLTPTQIGTDADWASVAVGGSHSLAVKTDGRLWTWGNNSFSQLGNASGVNRTSPIFIAYNLVSIAAGEIHSFGLGSDGIAYAWGSDVSLQLGNGTRGQELRPTSIDWPAFTLPVAYSSITKTQAYNTIYNNSCTLVTNIVQAGGSTAISGSTTAKVWIETTQPATYGKRHYEITPVASAATATGRVTLYFTQQEFTDFNAVNALKLPVDGADAANNKANLLIEKVNGASSDGTGLPATFSGTTTTINPADHNIVWNGTSNRWEITFDVTGFGGFFLKTQTGNLINGLNKAGLARATPAAVAYSLRLLSTDYSGYAIRVRRNNDDNTQDIGFTSDGSFDTVALKSFVGVNSGYVSKWYDQSGNGLDAEQTDVSKQPLIVTAGVVERINQQPAVYFGTANLATTKQVIFTNAASMVGVAKGNSSVPSAFVTKTGTAAGSNANYPGPFDYTNAGAEFTVGNAATTTYNLIHAGNSTPRSVINNQVPASVYSFVIPSSGTYYNYLNGVEAGSQTVNAFQDGGNSLMVGNRNDGSSSGNFWTPEVVLFNLVLSNPDRQTLEAAQQTYYFPSTLPLTWLSVKGQITDSKTALITWQVNETFVKNYQVEKSDDARSYTAIGHVSSFGDGVNNYSYTEPRILAGTGYYRIRQTDLDGRFTYSPVIKLTNEAVSRLTIFPNPANDLVTVSVGAGLLNSVASLHNANGQILQSNTISATSFTINLIKLPAGMYFLRTADGKVEKIFKK